MPNMLFSSVSQLHVSPPPADVLKQKLDDISFSYNYSSESILSVIGEACVRYKQPAWVPCIHCMNELEITVLRVTTHLKLLISNLTAFFYDSIAMLIIANLLFEAIY